MEKEIPEIQTRSTILENTIKIIRRRLQKTRVDWYQKYFLQEYLKIDSYIKGIDNKKNCIPLTGYVAEGLFYTIFSTVSKKDIEISSGKEDINGTDFIVEGKPLNVTINPRILNGKFKNYRPPNILLPTYKGQTLNSNNCPNDSYTIQINNNNFPYEEYLHDTLSLNHAILREMDYCLNNCCNDSPLDKREIKEDNYNQLRDVLSCLATD